MGMLHLENGQDISSIGCQKVDFKVRFV